MSDHPFTQSYIDHINMLVGQIDRATLIVEQLREENTRLNAEIDQLRAEHAHEREMAQREIARLSAGNGKKILAECIELSEANSIGWAREREKREQLQAELDAIKGRTCQSCEYFYVKPTYGKICTFHDSQMDDKEYCSMWKRRALESEK